jgi:hypothetical protein
MTNADPSTVAAAPSLVKPRRRLVRRAVLLIVGGATFSTLSLPSLAGWIFFKRQIITASADAAISVDVADLDGDGDVDVLSASVGDNRVAWYENDGRRGRPRFTPHVISTRGRVPVSVHAADLDADGDLDVIAASDADNEIAWYENDGHAPPSFARHVISTAARAASSVFAADMDGDGDMDVLSSSIIDDKIAWYENDDGSPPSFREHVVTQDPGPGEGFANFPLSIAAVDLDGDRDKDILFAATGASIVGWYVNNGASPPTFVPRVIADIFTPVSGPTSVFAADMDADGDLDVLSASGGDDKITWYENDGARPPSLTARTITSTAFHAWAVGAADLDGDGDVDVLSGSFDDNRVYWYDNQGGFPISFVTRVVTTEARAARSVGAADLDGDGDLDVIAPSFEDDTVAWFENQVVLPRK